MQYTTIKQLAVDSHVTYEAIRKQLVKYHKELEGHVVQNKKTKLLDDYAVDFLKNRRRESPVVVINEERTETIERLSAELLAAQQRIIDLQDQVKDLMDSKMRYDLLLEDNQRTRSELDQAKADLDRTKDQLRMSEIDKELAQREAGSYRKSIFGFYRKTN